MGSGSSAKKKLYEAAAEEALERRAATANRDDPSWQQSESSGSQLRNCEMCGEMRRTACLENGKWFCVACQLSSGVRPKAVAKSPSGDAAKLRPQPQLRRGATMSWIEKGGSPEPQPLHDATTEDVKKVKLQRSMSHFHVDKPGGREAHDGHQGGTTEKAEGKSGRRRRRAKERAVLKEESMVGVADDGLTASQSPRSGAQAKFARAATLGAGALSNLLEERSAAGNYKTAAGLRELKNGLREDVRTKTASESEDEQPGSAAQRAAPQLRRLKLPGGHHTGDRVNSLITRYRFGSLILEMGQEGVVHCQARGEYTSGVAEDDVRLLVQFQAGHDWCLPLRHLSAASSYNPSRAAQLPGGHTWGDRVRSLVTYLNPLSGGKEVWLGESGVVIGPGQTKGKLAVRFDDKSGGEWNVWPSTLCAAGAFAEVVKQRLAGGLSRGDRVSSRGSAEGSRSVEKGLDAPKKLQLRDGEEGTVIGPGHTSGWVLVHFDSDEKVWSLRPSQLRASASCV